MQKRKNTPFTEWAIAALIGSACFLILLLLSHTEPMRFLELRTYDFWMRGKPVNRTHYPDPNIVIIALDEESFRNIEEPYLLWMPRFTRMIQMLKGAGARVIGLDILFQKTPDELIRHGTPLVLERAEASDAEKKIAWKVMNGYYPHFDNELGLTLRESNAVLACWIEERSGAYLLTNREISDFVGKESMGSAVVYKDIDGVIRTISSHWTDVNQHTFPTFSFLIASRYLGKDAELYNGKFLKEIVFYKDTDLTMLINYVGPWGTFRHFSFINVDEKARMNDRQFFDENFKDGIVLIGATDLASQDLKKTPFNSNKDMFSGIEIHANAINTILHHDFIKRLNPWLENAIMLLLSIICFYLGLKVSSMKSVSVLVLVICVYTLAAYELFNRANLWMDLPRPLFSIVLAFSASYIYRYLVVDREGRWLKGVLSRYVSKPVAEAIIENPEMLRFGGEEREITALFSDINNFTTISESKKPEEIMSTLNEYFTLMETIIFRNRGTLKQFVGDEIMVIFGAPERQEDHKQRAVRTAVEMIQELEEWKKRREHEGKIYFDIKIGIHCGRAVIGNVGSPNRTEYAAVGDCVNTASRIMGLTKKLNSTTLISEDIFRDVQDMVVVEDKGAHEVKGKGHPIRVYSLTGLK